MLQREGTLLADRKRERRRQRDPATAKVATVGGVSYGSSWNSATHAPPELHPKGVALRELVDRQLHAYYYSFGGNSIAYNPRRASREEAYRRRVTM
jgi:hypothetical protein